MDGGSCQLPVPGCLGLDPCIPAKESDHVGSLLVLWCIPGPPLQCLDMLALWSRRVVESDMGCYNQIF